MSHLLYPQETVILNKDPSKFTNYSPDFTRTNRESRNTPGYIKKIVDSGASMTPQFLQIVQTKAPDYYEKALALPILESTWKPKIGSEYILRTFTAQATRLGIVVPKPVVEEKLNFSGSEVVNSEVVENFSGPKIVVGVSQEDVLPQIQNVNVELERVITGVDIANVQKVKNYESTIKAGQTNYVDPAKRVLPQQSDQKSEPFRPKDPRVVLKDLNFDQLDDQRRQFMNDNNSSNGSNDSSASSASSVMIGAGPSSVINDNQSLNTDSYMYDINHPYFQEQNSQPSPPLEPFKGYSETSKDSIPQEEAYEGQNLKGEPVQEQASTVESIEAANIEAGKKSVLPNSSEFKKIEHPAKYHLFPIKYYLGNDKNPLWDFELLNNVFDITMPMTKEEIIYGSDTIIKTYGSQLLIQKRLSDTLDEFHELIQLQFCVLRNLNRGTRTATATVPISSLAKFYNKLNGSNNSTPQPMTQETDPYVEANTLQEGQSINGSNSGSNSNSTLSSAAPAPPASSSSSSSSASSASSASSISDQTVSSGPIVPGGTPGINTIVDAFRARPFGLFGKPIIDTKIVGQTMIHPVGVLGRNSMRDPANLYTKGMASRSKFVTE